MGQAILPPQRFALASGRVQIKLVESVIVLCNYMNEYLSKILLPLPTPDSLLPTPKRGILGWVCPRTVIPLPKIMKQLLTI
jgi:hypothetical protein